MAKAEIAVKLLDMPEIQELLAEARARIQAAEARIAELEHTITQYLDSHGTAGTGVLGGRLKAAVGRVDG